MLIYDVLHKESVYHSVIGDLRNYGVKYRFKKNMFKTERLEGNKQISKKVFKTPLSYQPLDVVNLSSGGIVHVPVFVSQAAAFLEKHINQEGLFRKAGSQLRQKELTAYLDSGGTFSEKHHVIDVATILKMFFRNLPEPLIPYTYHDLFVHCVMLKANRVEALLLACILLPPHHLNTLAFFMEFLKRVSLCEKQNKMSIDNLAKVIGPNIMPLQETTMSAVQMRLDLHLLVVKTLIENAECIGILPDHITQAISMETIGSTDNELDVSDHSHSKFRKKKHRSGSLTRMFNGLKKIVGKNAVPEDGSEYSGQRIPENYDSNVKSTKKRKVDNVDPSSIKKKRVVDKDKSKKIRLSLDRFVPKKTKAVDESLESYPNTAEIPVERRWSSVSNTCDSRRSYRTYSDDSPNLRENRMSNELHREYDDMFIDADINLSNDSDEPILLTKTNDMDLFKGQSNSSSEELKPVGDFDPRRACPSKRRLTVNNFETYSRVQVTSVADQSEEYVTIPKSEYEDIKNRVSAIESRLSQEFACVDKDDDDLLPHSVKKVQTAYEKTLEETSLESNASTDYLATKLGKELKIRRSGDHKIIRSPSARKIGSLRRRSQERVMNKRVRRTTSWHISHKSDFNFHSTQEMNNAYPHNENSSTTNCTKDDFYVQPRSTSQWEEKRHNMILDNIHNEFSTPNAHTKKYNQNSLQSGKNRIRSSVRRVSSFHGNEQTNSAHSDDKNENLKKSSSQQNVVLNNTPVTKSKTPTSWKDAKGYFQTNQTNTPINQTGRASIAKLRTQNAGMVLAKAKLFDECTAKVYSTQNFVASKKNGQCPDNVKQSCERKSSKNAKSRYPKAAKHTPPPSIETEKDQIETCYYIPNDSANHKENVVKTSPLVRKIPINTIMHEPRLNVYKTDSVLTCKTPNIKKPLTVKTPKSGKALVRKSTVETRRTPLKAVSQLSTPKYQSPKSILKMSRNISRYT
ncbi:uncharacterized protein LOC108631879 isoform X2 [Ceratina calcarata]|uniref:Uncharacterized protein LOC108631879 isoform X2 n=1 Tax=Ceratina calcarata TaxID=156304 RepID=A0AAJ7JEM8_9HYME|nr:uncharacterized protein LOC108631879 isoform X2 [Ceratina calcarata]